MEKLELVDRQIPVGIYSISLPSDECWGVGFHYRRVLLHSHRSRRPRFCGRFVYARQSRLRIGRLRRIDPAPKLHHRNCRQPSSDRVGQDQCGAYTPGVVAILQAPDASARSSASAAPYKPTTASRRRCWRPRIGNPRTSPRSSQ